MSDRLTALETSFLQLEQQQQPMHVGSVMIFAAPATGFDYEAFVAHVRARIALVPRYRCRVRGVPGGLGSPVWVPDEKFDISYHVRRTALPRPGTMQQLEELVGRISPRQLDRSRPLWELFVVEGLHDNRIAVVTKTHPAMVDGVRAIDLAQVVLDSERRTSPAPQDTWQPGPEPGALELIAGAVADGVSNPKQAVRTVAGVVRKLPLAGWAAQAASFAMTASTRAPLSPLNASPTSAHRRYATKRCDLDQLRAVRDRLDRRLTNSGGDTTNAPERVTINDVVLGVIAGGLRHWLLLRGWPVQSNSTLRALLPVSVSLVQDDDTDPTHTGVAPQLVNLPVGEPNPGLRVQQIAFQLASHAKSDSAVSARAISGLRGFAPPTIHALGMRVAQDLSHRLFNVVITNVPGPQHTLYARRLMMTETYPVIPTMTHHALALGVTSYCGGVFFGANADRDAVSDLDDFMGCLQESLDELVELSR